MSSERERKRIADKVGAWDKFTTLIMPGDITSKQEQLSSIADRNEAEEKRQAELEAIKRRRMNAGQ